MNTTMALKVNECSTSVPSGPRQQRDADYTACVCPVTIVVQLIFKYCSLGLLVPLTAVNCLLFVISAQATPVTQAELFIQGMKTPFNAGSGEKNNSKKKKNNNSYSMGI